jgi:hypothetical protein
MLVRCKILTTSFWHTKAESDVAGFLGVSIERRSDGTIKLLQAGLIKRIIEALKIVHLLIKQTPAKLGVLCTDKDGAPMN